jgi:hypothetical protein
MARKSRGVTGHLKGKSFVSNFSAFKLHCSGLFLAVHAGLQTTPVGFFGRLALFTQWIVAIRRQSKSWPSA